MPRDEGRKIIGVIFYTATSVRRCCVLSSACGDISGILTAGTPKFDISEYTFYFIRILFKREKKTVELYSPCLEEFFDIWHKRYEI